MAKLLELDAGEATVLIAVREPGDAVVPVGALEKAIARIEASLDDVLASAARVASRASETLGQTAVADAELEFGIALTAAGKAYVVEASSEAVFTLRLKLKLNRARGV